MHTYQTHGVCARAISFDIDDEGKLRNVQFEGGCGGNTQGVAALAEGRDAHDIIEQLSCIKCGRKSTSCPAQLAEAVKSVIEAKS